MSLTIPTERQLTIFEQSSALVAKEAGRLEAQLETCSKLEATIPDLIRKNGELLASLKLLKGESDSLSETHQSRIAALKEQIQTLNSAINAQRKKADTFRKKNSCLQQQVDALTSDEGLSKALSGK